MRFLQLSQGRFATVDDADAESLGRCKWSATRNGRTWYAARQECIGGKRKQLYMHRVLAGVDGKDVDHEDLNGLNNQRHNLRQATKSQSLANRGKFQGCLSRFKGVYWCRSHQKWRAQVRSVGVLRHLGYFTEEEAAARAYDDAAKRLFGEFARLNFPVQLTQAPQVNISP